jgi:hypothetical protein
MQGKSLSFCGSCGQIAKNLVPSSKKIDENSKIGNLTNFLNLSICDDPPAPGVDDYLIDPDRSTLRLSTGYPVETYL